jgi:hypothetical protein
MNKYLLILTLLILSIGGIILAQDFSEGFNLSEGKNFINLSFEFNPIYVEDFIRAYPEITTVTYNNGTEEIGYVNIFGGIGENFVIYPNQIYEINTNQEVILNLR